MRAGSRSIRLYKNAGSFIMVIIMICLSFLLIAGCQQADRSTELASTTLDSVPEQTTDENELPAETQSPDVVTESEDVTDIDVTEQTDEFSSQFSENDLIISVGGQTFPMLEDAAELLNILGDDFAYNEAESCVYDGLDKTFDYGQVIVYTVPSGDIDLLDGIDILDQSIATTKGIQVGSSKEDVLAAYGQPASDEYDLTYNVSADIEQVGDPRLTFYLDDDDNVNLISYYSGSNAQN